MAQEPNGNEISINNILVIDEDIVSGNRIKQGLVSHGFEAIRAENRQAALEMLKSNKLELILLDLAMGGYKEGIPALREIRAYDPHIPVFVVEREKNDASLEASVKSIEIVGEDLIQAVVGKSINSIMAAIDNFSVKHHLVKQTFNEKIRETLGADARYLRADISQVEPEAILMKRKKRNSVIEKIQIVYMQNSAEKTIDLVARHNDALPPDQSAATYERHIYELFGATPFDCKVKLFDQWRLGNRLMLEYWADGFAQFEHNTLEEKYRIWNSEIKVAESSGDKEQRIAVEKKIRDELRKIVKKMAEMHFWGIFELASRVGFDSEKMKNYDFRFTEGEHEWSVHVKRRQDYKASFTKYVMGIAETVCRAKTGKLTKELDKILKTSSGKKDIFDWTEAQPMVLVHGDLHPRQIVYKTVDGEQKFKFIDFKNAKIGPGIIDFAFLQSPVYSCDEGFRRDLFNLYINSIEQNFTAANRSVSIPGISDIKSRANPFDLYAADRIRQIYWDIRIVNKINSYVKEYPMYEEAFSKHLSYAKQNLEKFIEDPDLNEQYPQARMLHTLLSDTIF
jgi:CheY-like chemotaxis protein